MPNVLCGSSPQRATPALVVATRSAERRSCPHCSPSPQHWSWNGDEACEEQQEGEVHEENDAPQRQTTPLLGVRLGVPLDPGPPWVEAVAIGYVAASVPLLGAPPLADSSAEAIDGSTLSFLLQHALEVKRKDEEAVEAAVLEEKVAAAEGRLLVEHQRERMEATRTSRQTWAPISRVEQLAVEWYLAKDVVVKRRVKRKKKKEEEDETQEEMAGGRYFYAPLFLRALVSGSHLFDAGLA